MQKRLMFTLVLLLAWSALALARPADNTNVNAKFQLVTLSSEKALSAAETPGVTTAAQPGTTFFGGTVWAADSSRWEAIQDSIWTFDSGAGSHFDFSAPGVNPYKYGAQGEPSPLHAYMEGWVGVDKTFSETPYFRRLSGSSFPTHVCVGSSAGLGGSYSFWAGVLPSEASALCYADGQGYGTNWYVCIEQGFTYNGLGSVTLHYSYVNDTEPAYDYTYVIADTTGSGDENQLAAYTGPVSGTGNFILTPGIDMRSTAGPVTFKFCVQSDGGYDDQDGAYGTACGAFAVDDITVTGGGIAHTASFESGADGWVLSPAAAGPGGEWSNIVDLASLPSTLTDCPCDLADSVLVFEDLSVGGHGTYQDNTAASPWIDLRAASLVGTPGKFMEYSFYVELPLQNYVFVQQEVQWYPDVCASTGKLVLSPWTTDGFVTYFGEVPLCTNPGNIRQQDEYGAFVSPGAEQMRIAFGAINYCRFYGNCSGVTNSTPWIDNVRLGVWGNPGAPTLFTRTYDRPQDAFPENGSLRINAPGRLDGNNVKGFVSPEPLSSLGDTLVVRGATGGAEVRIEFSAIPGPGTDLARFNSWLTQHQFEGVRDGLSWYSARLDSAEQGGVVGASGRWMTAYHESDPNFSGSDTAIDPTDLDPLGGTNRLMNDMFPDDLFTPGSRVNLFYKARYLTGASWYVEPDTALFKYYEFEVLPTSMAADSTFNCVLYVDRYDGRNFYQGVIDVVGGGQRRIEPALASILPGGSANAENTAWDRFDLRAPDSGLGCFGRPLNTEYGSTIQQSLGYKTIIWHSGDLDGVTLMKEDADVLIPWLTLTEPGLGFNNLYITGDDAVKSPTQEAATEPSALRLLNEFAGVNFACNTVRDPGCPSGNMVREMVGCLPVDPVGGATVANALPGGRAVQHLAQGNGCPQLRSFDVLDVFVGGLGNPQGDEVYNGPSKGIVNYASVVNEATGGPDYKTVVDGLSVHFRRDPSNCVFTTGNAIEPAVEERLHEVLQWFGYTGVLNACADPTAGTSVPSEPRQPTFKTALANFAPNPLVGAAKGTIQFTLAHEAKAAVDIFDVNGRLVRTVFDGTAHEGLNVAHWDGLDSGSRPVTSGVYFYRLRVDGDELAKKLVVVRNGS